MILFQNYLRAQAVASHHPRRARLCVHFLPRCAEVSKCVFNGFAGALVGHCGVWRIIINSGSGSSSRGGWSRLTNPAGRNEEKQEVIVSV